MSKISRSRLAWLGTNPTTGGTTRRTRLAILLALSALALSAAFAVAGASAATPWSYSNGFETDTTDWSAAATRVSSGTNGITSASGVFHAENAAGAFSQWGGYNFGAGTAVPTAFQEYSTSVDIYLNVDGGSANNTRFDFASAINSAAGTHRRDFIFNAGFYNDTDGSPGSGTNRFVISASNNSQPGSAFAKNPGKGPIAISTSGWYTFEHHFYNAAGVLAVDLNIYDASHALVNSWTLGDPSDLITGIGGNRYGWFDFNEFSTLAFDNSKLTVVPVIVPPTCTTVHTSVGDRTAAVVNPGADYAGPLPLSGCDIGVYFDKAGSVKNADIAGTTQFGVFADKGAAVSVTGSQIHQIGDSPFSGNQYGRAVFYATGTTGTVSGNDIYDYQKNGVVLTGDKTAVQVLNNTVTGRGHLSTITQNGVVVLDKATGLIKGNNISHNWYTGTGWTAYGLLIIDAKGVKQQANSFLDNQVNLGNFGRGGGNTSA